MKALLLLCSILLLSTPADAKIHRSASAKVEFKRQHPCPATGQPRGACPGFVVDHVDPLCHGGPDVPANMQWQTVEDAKVKDRWEREICRGVKVKF